MTRPRTVRLVVLAGASLGLVSRASDLLPRDLGWLGNLGAVWLAVAFAVGVAAGSPRRSALAGSASLTLAALVHYTSVRLLRQGVGIDLLRYPVSQWIAIGTVLGAVYGGLGSLWRRPGPRPWTAAALASAFGAEGLYLFVRDEPNAVALAAPLEVVASVTLPIVLSRTLRERLDAAACTVAMAPVGVGAILGIVATARRVY